MIPAQRVYHVKRDYEQELLGLPNVVGVGVGLKEVAGVRTETLAIVVGVEKKKKPLPFWLLVFPLLLRRFTAWILGRIADEHMAPRELEGVETDVVEWGKIDALADDPTKRYRPAPGGVSIGHYKVTAGTLGCIVRDKITGGLVILSNNHVMANSNNAEPGDAILQPGDADGGTEADDIASLTHFIPIALSTIPCPIAARICDAFNALAFVLGRESRLVPMDDTAPPATNEVDCAVAAPHNEYGLDPRILEIGYVKPEIKEAELDLLVQKYGRTTKHTWGRITAIGVTVNVNYGGLSIAAFVNQIAIESATPGIAVGAGGDSGSLFTDKERRPVGLLFAGSDKVTMANEIGRVMDALDIEFVDMEGVNG